MQLGYTYETFLTWVIVINMEILISGALRENRYDIDRKEGRREGGKETGGSRIGGNQRETR